MQRHNAGFNVWTGPAVPVLGVTLGISDQLRLGRSDTTAFLPAAMALSNSNDLHCWPGQLVLELSQATSLS